MGSVQNDRGLHLRAVVFLFVTLACLTGCAAQQQVPSWQQDYQNAFNRPEFETKVTVEHRPLTQEELAAQEAERKRLATLPRLPSEIIVTTGALSQPYEVLGEVHVSTVGMINLGSILNDALFRSPLERAAVGPTPTAHTETMNKMLRDEAVKLYGGKVDAVINANYHTDPNGNVFASGLGVRFVEPSAPAPTSTAPARSTEDRLKELLELRQKGLITLEEYYEKRQEILGEL